MGEREVCRRIAVPAARPPSRSLAGRTVPAVDHRRGESGGRGSGVSGEGAPQVARAALHARAHGLVGLVPHRHVEPQETLPERLVSERPVEVEEQTPPQAVGAAGTPVDIPVGLAVLPREPVESAERVSERAGGERPQLRPRGSP